MAALIQNAKHLVDDAGVREAADLQIADGRIRHLASDHLLDLDERAFHRELERLRCIQAGYLDPDIRAGFTANHE